MKSLGIRDTLFAYLPAPFSALLNRIGIAGKSPAGKPLPVFAAPLSLTILAGLIALAFIPSSDTWVTLTVAGLAMGMMIFLMASGFTLVFGLMDVLNFGHGAFITLGAFIGYSLLSALPTIGAEVSLSLSLMLLIAIFLAAGGVAGAGGLIFEKILIKPVYGSHLKQILITMGGLIIVEQMIYVVWGANPLAMAQPPALRGVVDMGVGIVEKYRLLAVLLGLGVFVAMQLVLSRTKIGLLVRAGVEDREMVEAMGYRIGGLFLATFVVGSALAGVGGAMWGFYQELITPHLGSDIMTRVFIVVIIGGLGSVQGCFWAAILAGLGANYIGFLYPPLAPASDILLMTAILLWRPRGLLPLGAGK